MTPREFEQCLDRWGADIERWPAAQAQAARSLLAADDEASLALAAERQVDEFVAGLRHHVPPAHLAARITARANDTDQASDPVDRMIGWFGTRLWRPALIAVLVTSAGFLTGMNLTVPAVDTELADDVMTLAFNDIYAEMEHAQP